MNCPVDATALLPVELATGLPAFHCPKCSGHWLRFGDYLVWRERQPADMPEVRASEAEQPAASPTEALRVPPRRCPDGGQFLTRYPVGHGISFGLDRCNACNGVWLDGEEWSALRARGLHDNLREIFGLAWQFSVRTDEQRQQLDARFAARLGSDMERARDFADWIAAHPRRSEILAYVQSRLG